MTVHRIDRRHAIAGAAGIGAVSPFLAACGDDEGAADQPAGGAGSVSTSDVPVGGGVVLADDKVVVTQPSEGDFKAFSAECTHQGCLVGKVESGEIVCPCHGSAFSVSDGSVVTGPATEPLAESEITVQGDRITLG